MSDETGATNRQLLDTIARCLWRPDALVHRISGKTWTPMAYGKGRPNSPIRRIRYLASFKKGGEK
jgi:hypothetical protein